MSRYGKVIEDIQQNSITNLHTTFSSYFDNPKMTKTSQQGSSSVYVAKVNSGLMLDNKYIVVVVNGDNKPIGSNHNLSELNWISLQTRTVRDVKSLGVDGNIKISSFTYSAKRTPPFTDKILLKGRSEGSSVYRHENLKELSITLLNSEKMQYEYPPQGTLSAALETYRTVIVLE